MIQTLRHECLNHFIVFGRRHLEYLIAEFVAFYNRYRAHSSREYLPPACSEPPAEDNSVDFDQILCREHLGGLLKRYERRAA